MKLNNEKFEFINHNFFRENINKQMLNELPFSTEYDHYKISDTNIIPFSETVRNLGIFIDCDFNWDFHRNNICKKAKKTKRVDI